MSDRAGPSPLRRRGRSAFSRDQRKNSRFISGLPLDRDVVRERKNNPPVPRRTGQLYSIKRASKTALKLRALRKARMQRLGNSPRR